MNTLAFRKLTFLFVFFIISQQSSGNTQFNYYFFKSKQHLYIHTDSSVYFADKLNKLAVDEKNTIYLAKSTFILGINYYIKGNTDKAIEYLKSSSRLAKQVNDDSLYLLSLMYIGEYHYNNGEYDTSYRYFKRVEQLSRNQHAYVFTFTQLYLSKYYYSTGQTKKSELYNTIADSLATIYKFKDLKVMVYNKIGKDYETLGDYAVALQYYNLAFDIAIGLKNNVLIGTTYNHLANIYQEIGYYEQALLYNHYAIECRKKIQYKEGMAKSYKNIAQVLIELNRQDEALIMLGNSKVLCEETGYTKGYIKALTGIGSIYRQKQNYDSAYFYLSTAIDYSNRINYAKGKIIAFSEKALTFLQNLQYDSAAYFFKKSMLWSEKMEIKEVAKKNHWGMYSIFMHSKNFEQALYHYTEYARLNDYFLKKELNKAILQQKIAFEIEKKNKQNAYLYKENELKDLVIQNKNRTIILFIGLIMLLITLSISLYLIIINKRRSNKQLIALNKELNKVNREKDKFFAIIAHELRNPLWWFRNMSGLLNENFDTLPREKMHHVIQSLDESAKVSYHLCDNLLNWSRTKLNRVSAQPISINLLSIINENLKHISPVVSDKKIKISNNVDSEIMVYADKEQFSTIVRNVLSNALKYTPANGQISITAKIEDQSTHLVIQDTGIGMNDKTLKSIAENKMPFATMGLMGEKGSGLGLALCQEFTKLNHGEFKISSKENQGTCIEICFPNNAN